MAIMEINLDITGRKRTEDTLRRQAALLDMSPDAYPDTWRGGNE